MEVLMYTQVTTYSLLFCPPNDSLSSERGRISTGREAKGSCWETVYLQAVNMDAVLALIIMGNRDHRVLFRSLSSPAHAWKTMLTVT